MANLVLGAGGAAADAYTIDQSLRFNSADTPVLKRTLSSNGSGTTYTFSCWVKRAKLGAQQTIFITNDFSANGEVLEFNSSDQLYWYVASGGAIQFDRVTTQLFRDVGSWYHIVIAKDTTQDSAGDRIKLYVNGEEITAFGTSNDPAEDAVGFWNRTNYVNAVSGTYGSGSSWCDLYLAEVYNIDGTQYSASDFGETDDTTNQWKPIDAVDDLTFGTNGFYQKYASTALANSFTDSSNAYSSAIFTPTEAITVDCLVVAGGGGGGRSDGASGAGGAGGLVYQSGISATSGTDYAMTVGAGGVGVTSSNATGNNGLDSVAFGMTAVGGGGGSGGNGNGNQAGAAGGSGGAGGYNSSAGGAATQGDSGGGTGFGNAGGTGYSQSASHSSGGGGGSGGAGGTGGSSTGGTGGTGKDYSATFGTGVGDSGWFASGGGGGVFSSYTGGSASSGGGGAGNAIGGTAGTANTGGGAGGGTSATDSSAGGSGVVVVRYEGSSAKATGGTITTVDLSGTDYQVHTFTKVGPHTITAVGDATQTTAVKKIGSSSIAFDGTGDYLSTPSAGIALTGDFTIEFWFYTASSTSDNGVMSNNYNSAGTDGNFAIAVNDSGVGNNVSYRPYDGTVAAGGMIRTLGSVWTDNTWTHCAVVRSGSGSGNVKIYIAGSDQANQEVASESSSTIMGNASTLNIGAKIGSSTNYIDGYMDEIRISNIARYTEAFTPSTTEFTADSNTMLLIHSNWDGGLGADSSGNFNTFTPTNLVATDQMVDSPTNNFPTWNPLLYSAGRSSYAEGNLKSGETGSGGGGNTAVTITPPSTGKWYWEQTCTIDGGDWPYIGTVDSTVYEIVGTWTDNAGKPGESESNGGWKIGAGGSYETDGGGESAGGQTYGAGDIVQFALDLDNGALYYGVDNVWYTPTASTGDPTSGASRTGAVMTWTAGTRDFLAAVQNYASSTSVINFGQDSSFAGAVTAQGNSDGNGVGDFYYTPPGTGSGAYLALCTSNLSDPEIKLPSENFKTLLWTGTGGARDFTGVGFQPDFVWSKARSIVQQHNLLDSLRGGGKTLASNTDGSEQDDYGYGYIDSFDADGFSTTTGEYNNYAFNKSLDTYVAWNWLAGTAPTADNSAGAGATPTAGSVKIDGSNLGSALAGTIAATRLSANTTAGFSVVKYTGNVTSGATVSHGLSETPFLILIKPLEAVSDWVVYSEPVGPTAAMQLNLANDPYTYAAYFNNTAPTASVFSLGSYNGVNASGEDFIAYCFHSVPGYSKIGSYEGNADADGTFVYTGFRTAFLLLKSIDDDAHWEMEDDKRDPYNLSYHALQANLTNAEDTSTSRNGLDFVSNGFKFRSNSSNIMNGSETYLYLAFAESPFKYANAR